MHRLLQNPIIEDLESKIVLLSGPRQAGKTTLSKMLFESFDYLNYDDAEHRLAVSEKSWDRSQKLVIFDELHKMNKWKSWIKGVYDTEGIPPRLLVTGSARMDTHRKMGDSLAGRFYHFRLHPFDPKEVAKEVDPAEAVNRILQYGGFPEPFLSANKRFYNRWRRSHLDIILRQDLLDLETITDIKSMETLVELLKHRVGSPISYASLARDLERDAKTIKRWLTVLENLYVIFRVPPYSRNVARSLLKEPKFYFYDTGLVQGDDGKRVENLVATVLKKELDFIEDVHGDGTQLYYLRTKDGREIDFAVAIDRKIERLIEVKNTDVQPSRHFAHFSKTFPKARSIQLVYKLKREKTYPSGVEIRDLAGWLAAIDLLGKER
jgi:predicted AAA+ superfamily ATPase